MRHYFIVNPAAGKGNAQAGLVEDIHKVCTAEQVDYTVYTTTGIGDAERFVREHADEDMGSRFYACGGDGTLCEVVNGAASSQFAEVGVIPVGTGNDFVRNFTRGENFIDIRAQIYGTPRCIDLIKYNERYFINMINTGFDCEVVRQTAKIKRNSFVPGKLAYILGVVQVLIRKPGVKMRVSVDGGEPQEKNLLLTCVGNGGFCGGGFKSEPYASLVDGLMEVSFVHNLSRLEFVAMVGSYKNGSYLERKDADKIAEYVRATRLDIDFPAHQGVSVDGEVEDMEHISISVLPGGLKFSMPDGVDMLVNAQRGRSD